jgi:2-iminobutanoate/2-iminopropanoate deaminase
VADDPEHRRWNPPRKLHFPPWRPCRRDQSHRRRDGAFDRHFPLHDDVGSMHGRCRIVQQAVQDVGRPGERQRAEDAERLAGRANREKIVLDDAETSVAQPFRPRRIRLDGYHPQRPTDEGARQRSRTRAYLEDELAWSERRLLDDLIGRRGIKKVLPELAPSPVAVCPPPGGHGRTPSSSWRHASTLRSPPSISTTRDEGITMLTAHTLNDRILAHSSNAAHGMEVPPNARLLFCNGQVGARLDGTVPEDRREQIEVIFDRIRKILVASSMTFADVVKFTVYVTDKSVLDDYFLVRASIMGDHNPPATLLIVDKFPRPGVEVEIETIAAKADVAR